MSAAGGPVLQILQRRELGTPSPRVATRPLRTNEAWAQRWTCTSVLSGHGGCVNTIHFSADGQQLISGSDDRTVGVWTFLRSWEGEFRQSLPTLHVHNVFDAQPCPGREHVVVTTAADGLVGVSYMEGGRPELLHAQHSSAVTSKLSFQPGTPDVFLVPFSNGYVRLYDLRAPRREVEVLARVCTGANDVKFRPHSTVQFALGADDPILRLCDLRAPSGADGEPSAAVVRQYASRRAWTADAASRFRRWSRLGVAISGVCWSECGLRLLVNYRGADLALLHISDRGYAPTATSHAGHGSESDDADEERASADPDADSADVDLTACVREYEGRENVQTCCKEAAFLLDGACVATGGDDGSLYVWRTQTAALLRRIVADRCIVNCVAPHPLLPLVATSGIDSEVKLWDVGDERQPVADEEASLRSVLRGEWNRRMGGAPNIPTREARARLARAAELRLAGNARATAKEWQAAIGVYRDAEGELDFIAPTVSVGVERRELLLALWLNLSLCMLHVGRHAEVISLCDRVLERNPKSVKALFRRASALLQRKEYDDAEGDVAAALEIEPRNTELARLQRSIANAQASQRRRDSERYRRIFAEDNDDAGASDNAEDGGANAS